MSVDDEVPESSDVDATDSVGIAWSAGCAVESLG